MALGACGGWWPLTNGEPDTPKGVSPVRGGATGETAVWKRLVACLLLHQIPTYIANKKDPSKIHYLHESLEPILNVTYGCIVYQEQVMQIVRDLAGFSMGRSDIVRRAMSKKKGDEMERLGDIFINGETDAEGNVTVEGCLRRGIPKDVALKIWDEMRDFAKYAFNKSHAAAYAVIACQTAWLKAHYPAEFYAALLSSVMDNESRVSRYIEECHRRGIKVAPPSVNDSEYKFTVKNGEIVFGLGGIKNVGTNFIESILKARRQLGPFKTMSDFCERVDNSQKRMVISLIKAGAFDYLGIERGKLLANAYEFIAHGQEMRKIKLSGQTSFFESNAAFSDSAEVKMVDCEPLSQETVLSMEKEVLGIYLSGHPLRKYREILNARTNFNLSVMDSYEELSRAVPDQSFVTLGGLLTGLRTQLTKKGDLMAFARLEDQFGSLDLVLFPKSYERAKDLLIDGAPVLVNGKITYNEDMEVSLLADNFELLEDVYRMEPLRQSVPQAPAPQPMGKSPAPGRVGNGVKTRNGELIVSLTDMTQRPLIKSIKKILKTSPGSMPVILYFEKENKRFKASDSLNVKISDQLVQSLTQVLDHNNVEVY